MTRNLSWISQANGSMTDVQVEEMKQALESQFSGESAANTPARLSPHRIRMQERPTRCVRSDEDAEIKKTFEYYDDGDSGELEADEIKALIMCVASCSVACAPPLMRCRQTVFL